MSRIRTWFLFSKVIRSCLYKTMIHIRLYSACGAHMQATSSVITNTKKLMVRSRDLDIWVTHNYRSTLANNWLQYASNLLVWPIKAIIAAYCKSYFLLKHIIAGLVKYRQRLSTNTYILLQLSCLCTLIHTMCAQGAQRVSIIMCSRKL